MLWYCYQEIPARSTRGRRHGGILCVLVFFSTLLSLTLTTTVFAADAAPPILTLATNAFLDVGALPVLYTCDSKNVSPELSWTNPPAKSQTFAMIVSDPNAPSGVFYHWVLYNLPKTTKELTEGMNKFPAGTLVGKNSFDKTSYSGPCPPKGSSHKYIFTLYALDSKLNVPAGAETTKVLEAMKSHILKTSTLTAIYSRWLK